MKQIRLDDVVFGDPKQFVLIAGPCVIESERAVFRHAERISEIARSLNIPYVIIIGKEELKQNKVKLRDMKTGKEKFLTATELILKFKKF